VKGASDFCCCTDTGSGSCTGGLHLIGGDGHMQAPLCIDSSSVQGSRTEPSSKQCHDVMCLPASMGWLCRAIGSARAYRWAVTSSAALILCSCP
jgi:hypothetical protein